MAIIQSDNPGIEKHLRKLEDLIEEGGGGLHSELVINSQGGDLSVETKEPMAMGREIIRLTRAVLLPEDQYVVGVSGDDFTLEFPEGSMLTDLQKGLADCMISLYNETGKVQLHKSYSFLLSLADYPEILDILEEGREMSKPVQKWRKDVESGMDEKRMNQFIAETFLKTRHLGYSDHIRVTNVSILMPVVDFLNHHWGGASFQVKSGVRKGDLAVGCNQVNEGSKECYAFYGTMDAFDAFVRYDFVDSLAPIVRSVPIDLDVPGVGKIVISAPTGGMSQKKPSKAMADLARYMPNMKLNPDSEEKQLDVTHLIIPALKKNRMVMRRLLRVILNNLIGAEGDMDETQRENWITEAEGKVIQKNLEYYQRLLSKTQALIDEKGSSPGLENVKTLAELQLGKLETYQEVSEAA